MNPTMGLREWLLLIVLSLLWGGSFFFVEIALAELPPLTVVTGRVGFAALALWTVALASGERLPRGAGTWAAFLLMGALNGLIPYTLMVWGQVHIDSGLAAILNATTPLFSVLLAHALTDEERLTPGRLLGVLLGLAGVVVLIGPAALGGLGVAGLAQLAILGGACSYALAAIFGRRFRGMSPLLAASGQISATFLLVLPIGLWHDRWWQLQPSTGTLAAVLGLSLLSTAVAYLIYFRLLARAGATNVLLVTFLIPLSALALGHLFLGERLGWDAAAGMLLIFAGIAAVDGRLGRALRAA